MRRPASSRRRMLVLALALANALAILQAGRDDAPAGASLRAQRAAAQRAALTAGRTTYCFETAWTPPFTR